MRAAARHDVRLVALVSCALIVLLAAPAVAALPETGHERRGSSSEREARRLLERAVHAARTAAYTGTQYVASWAGGGSASALSDVSHDPALGPPDAAVTVGPAGLEAQLLDALAAQYALRVAGDGHCTGRDATLVEARRPGVKGAGSVAGRFWLDRESGLALRREVYDDDGRTVSSTAFIDLVVSGAPEEDAPLARDGGSGDDGDSGDASGDGDTAALDALRRRGWDAPQRLPGGFTLFDVSLPEAGDDGGPVHLTYSDGLSTLSLFAQEGELGGDGPDGAFRTTTVQGAPVWVHSSAPERIVWSGGDRVWTLVSDAPTMAAHAAVGVLPHDPPPRDGLLARLGRGLKRMGEMLNPFG